MWISEKLFGGHLRSSRYLKSKRSGCDKIGDCGLSLRNDFIGSKTGKENTTGQSNVFIGDGTGEKNTVGERNI